MKNSIQIKLHGKLRLVYIDGQNWKVYNPTRHRFKFKTAGKERTKTRVNHGYFYCRLNDERCVIPEHGTMIDFNRLPCVLRWICPAIGRRSKASYCKAAVIQNELYRTHELTDKYWKTTIPTTRLNADIIYRQVLKECGVGKVRRWLMYNILRVCGRKAWKSGGRPLFEL